MLAELADSFGYETDGAHQHVALPFRLNPPGAHATHPEALGGKLTVSETGFVAGMILDSYDPSPHGTMTAERLAVWSMDDEQLERLAAVANDALAMRRAIRAMR